MFYYLAIFSLKIYLNILYKIKIYGKENIPKNTGVIFCSNHTSNFDPIIVCSSINRKVCYIAKKELFSTKFKSYWMKQLCAFPIDRESADINALKHSIKILKEGKALGIFSQGTRSESRNYSEAKNGVSLFALKSGACVVPIGINAKYSEKRGKVNVNIGKPIYFEKYKGQKPTTEVLSEMTREIMEEISKLL